MRKPLHWRVTIALIYPLLAAAGTPDFTLKDVDGADRNVNEFIGKGKWVVVAVWSADCPICRRDMHRMAFFHDEHQKKDATVLGVSIDAYANKDKVLAFIADHGLDFPNLIGEPGDMAQFGSGMFLGTPTFYFFSPEGQIMASRIGAMTQEQVEKLIASLEAERRKDKKSG